MNFVISWSKSWEWVFSVWGLPLPFAQWLLGYASTPVVTSSCCRVCLEVITVQCLADLSPQGEQKVNFQLLQTFCIETTVWISVCVEFKNVLNLHGLTNCHWQSKSSLNPSFSTHRTAFCVNLDIGSDIDTVWEDEAEEKEFNNFSPCQNYWLGPRSPKVNAELLYLCFC